VRACSEGQAPKVKRNWALMQFESHSHRGFSPVISTVTKQGNRLNGFSRLFGNCEHRAKAAV
jgi:hypothetical protein